MIVTDNETEAPMMDEIDAAIDRLAMQAEGGVAAPLTAAQAAQERARMIAEGDGLLADPLAIQVRAKPPADIWTIDSMEERKPTVGDLDGDGTRLFTFRPLLGKTYCQKRFALARDYKEGDNQAYAALQIAYSEIIWYCMKGCQWGVRETVEDENGNPVYEKDEAGDYVLDADENPIRKTVPLPLTQANVERLGMTQLLEFLEAMSAAMRGKARKTA